jgi:tRNA(Ile)-lysidine synthase
MNLFTRFKLFIAKENLFQVKDKLLLAVSGGVDSVVLCELCGQAGFDFAIAHCNFQLRGEESDRDEDFVKKLAEKYNVPVFVKRFDTEAYAREHKCSIQVAARELRYAWFNEIVNDEWDPERSRRAAHKKYIATAHHIDDNIETMLMNFFKGTGIAGLRGILPKQGKIIRPLLFATKDELKTFAEENNLS